MNTVVCHVACPISKVYLFACSTAGEAWTHNPLTSSQTLYHWATALPILYVFFTAVDFFQNQRFQKILSGTL